MDNPLAKLDSVILRRSVGGVALAYSGGVDSSFLKWRLGALGVRFGCFRADTPVLSVPEVRANAPDRCYHCKRAIFAQAFDFARRGGFAVVMDGTNADDLTAYRPGIRALREMGVVSPLAEAGMSKATLRRLAREAGLDFADAPSSPCLATRFPYGTPLTCELLARAEAAEDFLRSFLPPSADVRVRCEEGGARVELSPDAIPAARSRFAEIERRFAALGFASSSIDPLGYRPADPASLPDFPPAAVYGILNETATKGTDR